MNYEKMWNTLKAESGGRWCQPHPCSMELLTVGELMRNMERRCEETEEEKTKEESASSPQQLKEENLNTTKSQEDVRRLTNTQQYSNDDSADAPAQICPKCNGSGLPW